MNKIDLIIDNIMYAKIIKESAHQDELLEEALAAARELKALKPVAWMLPEYGDVLSASEADGAGIYNVPLYALDEANDEPPFKLSDAGADTNITRGLEPKGSGMVTLNQPEQEPVAWMLTLPDETHDWILDGRGCNGYVPLYTAPPRKEWYGLSDKDCDKAWEHAQKSSPYGVTRIEVFAKDIERRLKERNNAV
jgi:hypothetical protein